VSELRTLWKHQQEAFERAKDLQHFGLFFDPGVGKTATTITIMRHKFNLAKRYLRTLVFAPPVVLKQWKEEFKFYSKMDQERIIVLSGSGSQRLKTFLKHAYDEQSNPRGCIFVLNYETLLMKPAYDAFMKWMPEVVVCDEAHRLKNPKAKRTKLMVDLAAQAHLKYILTGTPVLNSPMDLFSQFEIMDGGQTFGRNFFAFRARYFVDKNAGMPRDRYFPRWEIRSGALEEISGLISAKSMSVRKSDALDLPPLVKEVIKIEMTPDQRKLYSSMKQDLIAFMGDEACVATMALTKALRLLQISSGYVKLVDGKEVPVEDNPKLAALEDLLEDIAENHKVIVWASFRQNYADIRGLCQKLGLGFVELHGEVSEKKRDENVQAFRKDPKVRVLIGHPGSGGVGVNLVEASYMIYYSRTFSLEHELQSEARAHRGGSHIHEKITRIDLICENSLEEEVAKKLASKEEVSFKILQDIKDRI
jgi:SNF2 family DNA or RNA helicase